MYVCTMYVCMYVLYVCMYVCMYVYYFSFISATLRFLSLKKIDVEKHLAAV
jgi:hypothetical protein